MNKKYELIKEAPVGGYRSKREMPIVIQFYRDINTGHWHSLILYRIRALRSFGTVKAGDIGGYIQSEANLSQEGRCWIHGDSKVYLHGRVEGDEQFCDNCVRMW